MERYPASAMSKVKLHFSSTLTRSDPVENPVIIIGQLKNLSRISFNDVRLKLEPRVTEEVFKSALASIQPSPTDICPLYRNMATLAVLPSRCSRHNAPSQPNFITKFLRSSCVRVDEYVVIVCERADVLPSACAVARAYPIYTRKTVLATSGAGIGAGSGAGSGTGSAANKAAPPSVINVRVEFVILPSCGSEEQAPLVDEDLRCLEDLAHSVRLSARIVDTPCNEMNVEDFTREAQCVADEVGSNILIIKGEELREKGFGGIYGVGKAASVPPALVVLSHTPAGATQTIAWVGKGIVYDTGGLSIKSRTGMPGMKRDCGGAAAILGAFRFMVKQGFSENLHAVFCLAENSVGPEATRPDDIHVLYSRRTVEINNTDAEGRLVLADGVAYAHKDLKANVILDMATLTGAQGISTGRYHAAVLTNREEWEQWVTEAGRSSGDLTFPIPYCPELHFPEFSSVLADMKNAVADRSNAQCSCAGLFILAQINFDFPGAWIHIDMASPVYSGERATGYGVALLTTLFGQYSKKAFLQGTSVQTSNGTIEEGNACKKIKRL